MQFHLRLFSAAKYDYVVKLSDRFNYLLQINNLVFTGACLLSLIIPAII